MKNESEKINQELNRISELLNDGSLTDRQYEQLYAAQQGITWAVDSDLAKSPVETVMSNLVQAPVRAMAQPNVMDIPAG